MKAVTEIAKNEDEEFYPDMIELKLTRSERSRARAHTTRCIDLEYEVR
jgi:hypothetical protein